MGRQRCGALAAAARSKRSRSRSNSATYPTCAPGPPHRSAISSATRSATLHAATRRGWVQIMRAVGSPAASASSRMSCGTWVVLPHPVSPHTTTTRDFAHASKSASLALVAGSTLRASAIRLYGADAARAAQSPATRASNGRANAGAAASAGPAAAGRASSPVASSTMASPPSSPSSLELARPSQSSTGSSLMSSGAAAAGAARSAGAAPAAVVLSARATAEDRVARSASAAARLRSRAAFSFSRCCLESDSASSCMRPLFFSRRAPSTAATAASFLASHVSQISRKAGGREVWKRRPWDRGGCGERGKAGGAQRFFSPSPRRAQALTRFHS